MDGPICPSCHCLASRTNSDTRDMFVYLHFTIMLVSYIPEDSVERKKE